MPSGDLSFRRQSGKEPLMEDHLLAKAGFLREVFDAIPAMLLILDEDVKILHLNATASAGLGVDLKDVFKKRGGEALHCIHSTDDPGGCGRAEACRDCIIRNSATSAMQGGKTFRKATRMEFVNGAKKAEMHLLVTAAPFKHEGKNYVLLTLENVSELIRLRSMLPICMHCKRIRNDEGYWSDVAVYFNERLDVDFSHGLCNECADKFYPEHKKRD
jgi:PAS domain-containing protein